MPPAVDPGWLVGPVPPGRRAEAGRRAATLTPTERDSCQKEGPLHCSWHKSMKSMNKEEAHTMTGGLLKSSRSTANMQETVADFLFLNVQNAQDCLMVPVYKQYSLKAGATLNDKRNEWYDLGTPAALIRNSTTIKRPSAPSHPFQMDSERTTMLSTDPGCAFGSKCAHRINIEKACSGDKQGQRLATLLWKRHLHIRYVVCMIYAMCQSYFDGCGTEAAIDTLDEHGFECANKICQSMFGMVLSKEEVHLWCRPAFSLGLGTSSRDYFMHSSRLPTFAREFEAFFNFLSLPFRELWRFNIADKTMRVLAGSNDLPQNNDAPPQNNDAPPGNNQGQEPPPPTPLPQNKDAPEEDDLNIEKGHPCKTLNIMPCKFPDEGAGALSQEDRHAAHALARLFCCGPFISKNIEGGSVANSGVSVANFNRDVHTIECLSHSEVEQQLFYSVALPTRYADKLKSPKNKMSHFVHEAGSGSGIYKRWTLLKPDKYSEKHQEFITTLHGVEVTVGCSILYALSMTIMGKEIGWYNVVQAFLDSTHVNVRGHQAAAPFPRFLSNGDMDLAQNAELLQQVSAGKRKRMTNAQASTRERQFGRAHHHVMATRVHNLVEVLTAEQVLAMAPSLGWDDLTLEEVQGDLPGAKASLFRLMEAQSVRDTNSIYTKWMAGASASNSNSSSNDCCYAREGGCQYRFGADGWVDACSCEEEGCSEKMHLRCCREHIYYSRVCRIRFGADAPNCTVKLCIECLTKEWRRSDI